MDREPGDDYIRRLASFVRNNEQALAQGGFTKRRRPPTKQPPSSPFDAAASALNPLAWFAAPDPSAVKPVTLTLDTHRLFYVLMRFEALGLDVGSLDTRVDNPSRPLAYHAVPLAEKPPSDAISLASSFRSSLSGISKLSLGGGWWSAGKTAVPSVDAELKYLFSCFNKVPALALRAPGPKVIAELADDPPNENALPLYAFRNLQTLECADIDPRALLGWDRLADPLVSLTITRSGVEDVSDVFVAAVLDDIARREETGSRMRHRRLSSKASFYSTTLPETVAEQDEDGEHDPSDEKKLPPYKWSSLRHLSLADNALTFIPSAPLTYFTALTHLDLSSNLLVSVPPGLAALYSLASLDLSDNMIDSVLGIYTHLGSVTALNLSRNRLDSLCGLERLRALERVDIRHNRVEEAAEVGRLATLPNVREVWVAGNPLVELEEPHRVRCFEFFWREGKDVLLDGAPAGFYERRYMPALPPEQMASSRPMSVAQSPPVVAVGSRSPSHTPRVGPSGAPSTASPPSTAAPSPHLAASAAPRGRKKKIKRIVDLHSEADADAARSRSGSRGPAHARVLSAGGDAGSPAPVRPRQAAAAPTALGNGKSARSPTPPAPGPSSPPKDPPPAPKSLRPLPDPGPSSPRIRPKLGHRHSRYGTEYAPLPSTASPFNGPDAAIPEASSPTTSLAFKGTKGQHQRSATLASRSAKRRQRVSASTFEREPEPADGEAEAVDPVKEADAYRARIEALRKDMGEDWLKVFSQTQLTPRSPPPLAARSSSSSGASHPP
ncbi:hypothetical protein PUNSTDRAFT_83341 [Punctularia strigosozonata HHB-11173 SS5]|uniref:uncharacterized protein n=1 Tax=Punctularia strigosozonata (strain HHB-11173) TaxID=741275 RepID=UPI00044176F1|nr:uncharacterized protein PUNSTDRAFT_83341 [Punctularia strigosozonata HHB-11173 SS5]EIN11652.1 hypothetical protein PUNSTDRAFT_83341 [Punctularia strigosozonata HHB-11173 SS5]